MKTEEAMDPQIAKEYAEKIGRITTEYHQLTQREEKYSKGDGSSLEEIKERKINIYKYIKRKAVKCEDKTIAFATLSFTPKMLKYLPDNLKNDKRFFFEAIKSTRNPKLLKYAESPIRNDIQCCISAIKLDHTLIAYVPDKIRQSDAMVTVYEWSKEMQTDAKNSGNSINLDNFGPDSDDIFFSKNAGTQPEPFIPVESQNKSKATKIVEQQWDEEPDYDEMNAPASNSEYISINKKTAPDEELNFKDLPEHKDEEPEIKHVNNKDFKKNSIEVETSSFYSSDDEDIEEDDEATLMPDGENKAKEKEKPKGFFGFLKRFFS